MTDRVEPSGTDLSEMIPDLKDRDAWIAWAEVERDGEPTKLPINPHDGETASSTDPDTWADYETAREYVESDAGVEGLGFVFPSGDTVAGVDLDHCVDPDTGEVEPWAADIVERLDSYTEVSPSGDGLHVLVHGFIPDGGNRKEGVEMYDSGRFFTVTGDHVEGTPTETHARNDALRSVHSEYVDDPDDGDGGDPGGSSGSSEPSGEIPDDDGDLIERAESAENGDKFARLWGGDTSGYDSHSEADMALAEMLAFWTGKDRHRMDRLFRQSGLMRGKWDEDRGSDTYGEITIQKAISRCGDVYDPGSVSNRERENGMDADEVSEPEREMARETVREIVERYRGIDDPELDGGEFHAIGDALGKLSGDDVDEFREGLAHVLDREPAGVTRDHRLASHLEQYGPVKEQGGRYVYVHRDGANVWTEDLTNFTIDATSFMEHSEDSRRVMKLEIEPRGDMDPEYQVDVEAKVFNRVDTFENNIVTGFSTRYDGGKPELSDLREYIAKQDAPLQTGTELMGLHDGATEFVTPEGTLTADGWADVPNTMHMGRDITAVRKWSVPREFKEYDTDTVSRLLELVPQTRDPERFLPAIGWFYASAVRPLVLDWIGHFPVLSVHGDTGSGKTATLSVLWQMFGMDSDPLSCTTTAYAQLSTFASSNAVPMWLDEYKPTDIKDRRLDALHEFIRKSTSGATEARGKPDGSTESYHLQAPVCVSGEQRFQGPAERRRAVMTNFRTETTDSETDTARAFARLRGDPYHDEDGEIVDPDGFDYRDHALAYYMWVLDRDTDALRSIWKQSRERVTDVVDEYEMSDLDDTERWGLQTIVFGWRLYRRFAESVGADTGALPGGDALDRALIHVAETVGPDGYRRRHVDVFMENLASAAFSGYVEPGKHFKIVNRGGPTEELRVNLKRAFPEVKRWARDHDMDSEVFEYDELRDRFRDESERESGYVVKWGQPTPPISRAVGIDMDTLTDRLDVDASMFLETEPDGDTGVEGSGDSDGGDGDGGGGPDPLAGADDGDWMNVTVRVTEVENDTPDAIAQKGTVRDTSGEMAFIAWSKSDPATVEVGECYRIRGAAVDTDDRSGGLFLSINSRTEVEPVSAGVGHAPAADPGRNATLPADAAERRADGGDVEDAREAVVNTLAAHDAPRAEREVVQDAADRYGMDTSRLKDAVSTLMENGTIIGEMDDGDMFLRRG